MNYFNHVFLSSIPRVGLTAALILWNSVNSLAFQWSPLTTNNIYTVHTGNVGIGSNAPVYKLEIASTTNARVLIKSTASPSPALVEVTGPSSTAVLESVVSPTVMTRIGSRTNHDVSIITNNTEKLVVKSDGKVGIGKTPLFPLDVNGAINASSFNIGGLPLISSQWTNNGSNINFSLGMVSIGTTRTPPGYKLAVGGKIITEEVVVRIQANWPDYVFKEDYKLPSLSDVERFIDENKHLPGIPDAQQVAREGVAVGELNTTLVKKIEELTLYLIAQERRIMELEKQVAKK
jgi:hypothetical protein